MSVHTRGRFQRFSARVHTPQHSRALRRSRDLTSCDPRVRFMAAPFDVWTKTLVRIHQSGRRRPGLPIPAARGGIAFPITIKYIISGTLSVTAEMICLSASWSWIIGNFAILWSLHRRRVVFKFAFWEKAAEWHLLGRCTLMRCQQNGKQKTFKFKQKWIDNSCRRCHLLSSHGRRQQSDTFREGAHSWDANEMASKTLLNSYKNEFTTRAWGVISWEATGEGISRGFWILA